MCKDVIIYVNKKKHKYAPAEVWSRDTSVSLRHNVREDISSAVWHLLSDVGNSEEHKLAAL